jgi:hypothetical protein
MGQIMNKVLAVGLLVLVTAASAQTSQSLGTVTEVQGVVTVNNGITVGIAARGTAITQGNHFVTASAGAARLTMDNGCVIHLKPNQSLRIDSRISCAELIASVQPVAGVPVTGTAGVPAGALGAGVALTAVAVDATLRRGDKPDAGGRTGPPDGGGGGVLPTPDLSGR